MNVNRIIILAFAILLTKPILGSHLRGGEITARLVDCSTNTYEITLTLYTNSSTPAAPGDGVLSFGDGSVISPKTFTIKSIDQFTAVSVAVFKVNYNFKANGKYLISYLEANRNNGIVNIKGSVNVPFYIESFLMVDRAKCLGTIAFSIPPVDRACGKFLFTHNPGATVSLTDSISYQLIAPQQANNQSITTYQSPASPDFYSSFSSGNELGNAPPQLTIDSDGTLRWDAPGALGEYIIAIRVFHWSKIQNKWTIVEWVVRDMQIIVEDCKTSRPQLILEEKCFIAGQLFEDDIRINNPSGDPVIIELFTSDNFHNASPQINYLNKIQSTTPPYDTAHIKIKWDLTCDLIRSEPYKLIFKTSAFTKNGLRISTFTVWTVKVSGPPPTIKQLNLNVALKALQIDWDEYPCTNISTMEVWRRVGAAPDQTDFCGKNLLPSLGFSKIGESQSGKFLDKTLSAGATYCYRLIAHFNSPNFGVSILSKDTCIGPMVIDAPVIVKTSVNTTNQSQGSVVIRWTSPFEINKSLFPKPYLYHLLRTTNGVDYTLVNPAKLSDTTYIDVALNTQEKVYGYKLVVYSPQSIAGENPLDTSALAFMPKLNYEALNNSIKLMWNANTPWSNYSAKFPYHYIYRKRLNETEFHLVDSIDVRQRENENFMYQDHGKKVGFSLQPNTLYQYKVETQGIYGNRLIEEPIRNFSNIVTAQPLDKDPPCTPTLTVETPSCAALDLSDCSRDSYTNRLNWFDQFNCGDDIAFYEILYFDHSNADSTLIAKNQSTSFDHTKINSMAGCYQIVAVDFSGNRSIPSEKVCIENCLNTFLPNVITTNRDGFNDSFPGLSNRKREREGNTCPRFIRAFSMNIVNRWGNTIFAIRNGAPSAESEWTGLDQSGKELPTGIYYYHIDIQYYTAHTESEIKSFKGFVQLMR